MNFLKIYDDYVDAIKKAQSVDRAEAEIVSKFAIFVHDAFGVDARDFIQEQTIRMAEIESSGRIDLLFGGLVLEFKKKITRNTGARQLENYLRGLADKGQEYTGIFTDGLQFEIYTLIDGVYAQVDAFDLSDMPAETARLRLDAYLFSQHNTPPTAEDIVLRYGNQSPTFRKASQELRRLLGKVKKSPMLETWRAQWERLLSKVYGSNVGDDELFVRHTYLSQFARLLAYVALNNRLPDDSETVKNIIKGDAFKSSGVNNIGEADFFSWILMDEIANDAVNLFNRLAQTFVVYNLARIDQDLLKQLYQNLVDAKDRHDLGEYYTPDWLAELTLRDIQYKAGQSLLDPTCGSGTFLFAAIKHLEKQGIKGWELVKFAVENIMGTDVHPLAVTIARINYLLALSEHLRQEQSSTSARLISIPVYMADALIEPLQNEGAGILTVPVGELKSNEVFVIPNETAQEAGLLTESVDLMEGLARTSKPDLMRFEQTVGKLHEKYEVSPAPMNLVHWSNNLKLLKKLIDADRNGIWAYILKNSARPLMFAKRQFDVIVGNPPWLSYRYIKNAEYQTVVKSLYLYYQLIESNQNKLFTQMDLSTLFYAVARDRYLKAGGTLAFVMPRSVITGAKQHRPFQKKGISRALDMRYVQPLFNVPTCVLIYSGTEVQKTLPTLAYRGKLPAHELSLDAAEPCLHQHNSALTFVEDGIRSPYYHDRFFQGATLVPRNFCFVKPEGNPNSPSVVTDEELDRDAKAPYKGQFLRGVVHDDYLYATLLSKHLLPFGIEKLHLVALPFKASDTGKLQAVIDDTDYLYTGHNESREWFKQAAAKWDKLKKENSTLSFIGQLNYMNKITSQDYQHPYKVVYNASGTNVSACVVDTDKINLRVYGRQTQGFIIDHKMYYADVQSTDEAHYLCALLNAPSVDDAIKDYQSYGLFGARDIHRTPLEACGIQPFDAANADHQALAELSKTAHDSIALLLEDDLSGRVSAKRATARDLTDQILQDIDAIAMRIVEM